MREPTELDGDGLEEDLDLSWSWAGLFMKIWSSPVERANQQNVDTDGACERAAFDVALGSSGL
jgi:hypothetical protein